MGSMLFLAELRAEPPPGAGAGLFQRNPRATRPGPDESLIPNVILAPLEASAEVIRTIGFGGGGTVRLKPLTPEAPQGEAQTFEVQVFALPFQWVQLDVAPEIEFQRHLSRSEWLVDPSRSFSSTETVTLDDVAAVPGFATASESGEVRLPVRAPAPALKGTRPIGRYLGVVRGVLTWN
jgi:hypothetical protein